MKFLFISFVSLVLSRELNAQKTVLDLEKQNFRKGLELLKSESIKALRSFPVPKEIQNSDKLNSQGKKLFTQLRDIIERASTVTENTSFETYSCIMKELNWATFALTISTPDLSKTSKSTVVAKSQLPPGMSGIGPGGILNETGTANSTCVTQCKEEYNTCMAENSCEHSLFCVCCIPCSLQYAGCIAACTIRW